MRDAYGMSLSSRVKRGIFIPRARSLAALGMTALFVACGEGDEPDAYGNFEATEVVVSAEASGQLLWFTAEDGKRLEAGSLVGVIDTTQLALERSEVLAQRGASASRANEVTGQIGVLETEREIAQRSYDRTKRLHGEQAATSQALDQAERDYRVLNEQIGVTRSQRRTAEHDVATSAARIAQIEDLIRRSRVSNPRGGTVLTSYAEAGEFVQQGQPLYKIAILDSMELRAYVGEPQLAQIRIGQPAEVTIDTGSRERRTLTGTVTWVSAEAEFTPTPVQTREERADLVYAVKIKVPNSEGIVKIGMPADVRFTSTADTVSR
jgi:HlyD family secretion protein